MSLKDIEITIRLDKTQICTIVAALSYFCENYYKTNVVKQEEIFLLPEKVENLLNEFLILLRLLEKNKNL